ncbi:hypothetical protein PCASD_22836 [Puccinia coronata f. sp. avenae]|uniref:Uncharacterized protein n=1 Tax=Puccinia coronata f. sp. avenae TaxID=200324 RepID=A0A2N5SK07_9BASI|nr:hypothetical protein PCASD_22836 [Puccinia coronata f. sp. avenae]
MARISLLTSPHPEGSLDNQTSIFYSDVEWMEYHGQTAAVLSIRDAKTSQPGEVQKIVLRPISNLLCPVEAFKRRLQVEGNPDNALFGYPNNEGVKIHLTKDTVTKTLSSAWKEICELGQWKSDCYQIYIRQYTNEELDKGIDLLGQLDRSWAEAAHPSPAQECDELRSDALVTHSQDQGTAQGPNHHDG